MKKEFIPRMRKLIIINIFFKIRGTASTTVTVRNADKINIH